MKQISIQKQKKFLLIPGIGAFIIMIIWTFINSKYTTVRYWRSKTAIYFFGAGFCTIPIIILSEFLRSTFPSAQVIVNLLYVYIITWILGIAFLLCQKKCGIE